MKQKIIWTKCKGEAHTNPYIDNCLICMPYWEKYPSCPYCKGVDITEKGKCRNCKKYSNMER